MVEEEPVLAPVGGSEEQGELESPRSHSIEAFVQIPFAWVAWAAEIQSAAAEPSAAVRSRPDLGRGAADIRWSGYAAEEN